MWAQFGKSADNQNECEHNLVIFQKWDIFWQISKHCEEVQDIQNQEGSLP